MKEKRKLLVIHIPILFFLIASLAFYLFLAERVYSIKNLEGESIDLLRAQDQMLFDGEQMFVRAFSIGALLHNFKDSRNDFESKLYDLIDSSAFGSLEWEGKGDFVNWYETQVDYLDNVENLYSAISVGIESLDASAEGVIPYYQNNPSWAVGSTVMSQYSNLGLFKEELISATNILVVELNSSAERNINRIITIVIISSIFFLIIAIGATILLSRDLSIDIRSLASTINLAAKGDFQSLLEMENEKYPLTKQFQDLANKLWFRLDAITSVFHDLRHSDQSESALDKLEEVLVFRSMELLNGDCAGLFSYNDSSSLELSHKTELFPKDALNDLALGVARQRRPRQISREEISEWIKGNVVTEESLPIGDYIAVPLLINREVHTILIVGKFDKSGRFKDLDFTTLKTFGSMAGLLIDNMNKYSVLLEHKSTIDEIEISKDVQKGLIPTSYPKMEKAEVAGFCEQAREIGGDYFDVIEISKEEVLIFICDVSGKGLPAAILMVIIRTALFLASSLGQTDRILNYINKAIMKTTPTGADKFATASLLLLNHKTGSLEYTNAAHHPLYLFRKSDKKFRRFDTDGMPLGIDSSATFQRKRFSVESGDIFYMYTDGIVEARNPDQEELGDKRLLVHLLKNNELDAVSITNKAQQLVINWESGTVPHDDKTFLAVKIR